MTVVVPATPGSLVATIHHRKNIAKLTAAQLAELRAAFKAVMAYPPLDDRGFEYFAGWHGVPRELCQHHNVYFLPWHRQYLYFFELALRKAAPAVSLVWWDWTRERKIPLAYHEAEVGGQPNPLHEAAIRVEHAEQGWPTETSRAPGSFAQQHELPVPAGYKYALAATNFLDFNTRITQVHDEVHMWVMGTMSNPEWAAYDPIFWAHHTMIDRAWALWQIAHPGANPPQTILDSKLRPNGMTIRETLEVTALGYDYAATTAHVAGTQG